MENSQLFTSKNIKTVFFLSLFMGALALVFCLIQQPKYESNVKLLTVFSQENMDPYTAGRNASYITGVLSEVIYSNTFIDSVFQSTNSVKDDLGYNPKTRQKNWQKTVRIKTKDNQGLIYISVFHPDREQSKLLANAVATTMIEKHSTYDGAGDKVTIKVIDGPITSNSFTEPNFLKNILLGLITGAMAGLALIVVFPEQKLFANRSKKDETIELSQNYSPNFYQFNLRNENQSEKISETNFRLQ